MRYGGAERDGGQGAERLVKRDQGAELRLRSKVKPAVREDYMSQVPTLYAVVLAHCQVIGIHRTAIGPLTLGNLEAGDWQELDVETIAALLEASRNSVPLVLQQQRDHELQSTLAGSAPGI